MKYKQSSQSGMITTPTFKLLSVTKAKVNSYINSLSVSLSKQHSKQSVPLKSQCQGFSLVETLVAITILLIIIIGPMTISSSTARSTSFASEQVVAYFLAQEGAELAQKARDDFLLENFYVDSSEPYIGWDKFTDDGGGTYKQCF
ncbi:prepilin-type N-terminal cleavage/methylation domain-containing protein [Candidatus Kaiserbacteria bacterium]|nr:prepilin-type N-terminal cleavage/methylation domain-containing protein [Candidatus Kaiserbacteria bacterium]